MREEVTRFFIGKNIKEPKAFGIYQDENGDYVVYKNKSVGERAIRYQGADEAYAVNDRYQKLKSEIANQKSRNRQARGSADSAGGWRKKKKKERQKTMTIILVTIAISMQQSTMRGKALRIPGGMRKVMTAVTGTVEAAGIRGIHGIPEVRTGRHT